jgi:hypothetical protein
LANSKVPIWRTGSGNEIGLAIDVWLREDGRNVPAELVIRLGQLGVTAHPGMPDRPIGWMGNHPLDTRLSRAFISPIDRGQQTFTVQLPAFRSSVGRRGQTPGVLTAQLSSLSASNTGPYWTVNVPPVRQLSTLLDRFWNVGEPFRYPIHGGLAVGVSSTSGSSIHSRYSRDCSRARSGRAAKAMPVDS